MAGWVTLVQVLFLVATIGGVAGCNSCGRRTERRSERTGPGNSPSCASKEDCVDLDPCQEADCVSGSCRRRPAPAGTPCGKSDACQTEAQCDGQGRCVAGEPVAVDDGNPCTEDSCDPARGPVHDPIDVDDGDACTDDTCDPETGTITHEPVDLDDGDTCTFDSCNPTTGVSHARTEPKYTCSASCEAGYYAASRRRSGNCPGNALQTFCQPVCGDSFYSCENGCPAGYRAGTRHESNTCGPEQPLTFCSKME